jgi:hypothetical protein
MGIPVSYSQVLLFLNLSGLPSGAQGSAGGPGQDPEAATGSKGQADPKARVDLRQQNSPQPFHRDVLRASGVVLEDLVSSPRRALAASLGGGSSSPRSPNGSTHSPMRRGRSRTRSQSRFQFPKEASLSSSIVQYCHSNRKYYL